MKEDEYRTIEKASAEILFKDRNSKFYGYAFPVNSEEVVKSRILELKRKHHSARHFCYAYQIGLKEPLITYRANDDGEPNNSAGMPIYGQIQSFELTNVLVVVVRYFGGTKLGVSGLINAYKTTAEMTLNKSIIVKRYIRKVFFLEFDYSDLNSVMRIIRENDFKIEANNSGLKCKMKISTRFSKAEMLKNSFKNLYKVHIKET